MIGVYGRIRNAYRALRARYPKFCNSGYGALNFGHGAGFEARPLVCAARCVASWRTGMEPTEFERLKQALKLQKERGAITLDEYLQELSSLQVPQVSLQRQGATGAADSGEIQLSVPVRYRIE